MPAQKTDIKALTPEELEKFLSTFRQPRYRALQIFKWLHGHCVENFKQMTNIPRELQIVLFENAYITAPKTIAAHRSEDGTVKYLREFYGGSTAESVLMKYRHGNTVCVSSQAGCRMGCAFCASTLNGLERNLEPSEIIDQVIFMGKQENIKISNIVLMGTGEPLDNYDNVLKFLKLVRLPEGIGIGHRHISLSTCGLADENLQITLSVSLHAPFDEIRSQIMPVNKAFPLKILLEACDEYYRKTSRRISFEYAMIENLNDNSECARQLAKIAVR